jgi:hypothetical protein
MLTIATFAAGITFNILLKPGDGGQPTPALVYLSYANSLFCAVLVGCALINISIELCRNSVDKLGRLGWKEVKEHKIRRIWAHDTLAELILSVETGVVGTILFIGIFFLLYSTSLFLQVQGPLILGLVLYGLFGVLVLLLAAISMWIKREIEVASGEADVEKMSEAKDAVGVERNKETTAHVVREITESEDVEEGRPSNK